MRASNIKTGSTALEANTGDYVLLAEADASREAFLLRTPATGEDINLCIGHETPTDADSFVMKAGSSIDLYTAPIGPIYARSNTTTVTTVYTVND